MRGDGFWRAVGIPVLLSVGAISGVNAIWNHPPTAPYVEAVPFALPVYLLAGSGLALFLLWRSLRAGRLSRGELGLGLLGWTAPKRLAGLALLVFLSYVQFAWVTAYWVPDAGPVPTWGDYCFWYIFFLMSSLAELLVFLGVAYCLPEAWLRRRGAGWPRIFGPAVFASVAFGLFHYSHKQEFHYLVFPLMPAWFCLILFFVLTRNFYMTLALHNAYVAIGFVQMQNSLPNLEDAHAPFIVGFVLVIFLIPFLLLHCLEGWGIARTEDRATG
jgi:hypothetical protein